MAAEKNFFELIHHSRPITINFTLVIPSHVKIEVFDEKGKKIFRLIDEQMESGEQKLVLNFKSQHFHLSKGNYEYLLTVNNVNGTFRQCHPIIIE